MKRPIMLVSNALSGGGAERAAVMLANILCEAGMQVVLVPVRAGAADLVSPTVDIELLGKRPGSELRGLPRSLAKFERVVRRVRPSVVHAHCELPELLAAAAVSSAGTCVTEHTRLPWQKWPRAGALTRGVLGARRTSWIVPQATMKPWRVAATPSVIPNPILVPGVSWAPRQTEAPLRVVTVSRLVRLKRCDWILRAAAQVPRRWVRVRIIGDGEARPELESLAAELGVDAEFTGQLLDPWAAARNADVFVTASSTEADPVALGEAIALGMPVLASDIAAHAGQGLEPRHLFASQSHLAAALGSLSSGALSTVELIPVSARETLLRLRAPELIARRHLEVYAALS